MLAPNTLLQNRYLIIRLLAKGGMGAVYEARDQRLGNIVALKETFFTEESLRHAFHREASLLATLRHSALPKVIDHFAEGDGQFLVMEFIRGDDLSRLLELSGQALAQADVLSWADQLLGALEYLHAQRPPIIHRDIKPQNLKLNERAEIVLLDFGLAKEAAIDASPISNSVRGYTLTYSPLEQIQGSGTDQRSDLYSAAATLYHLLTGVVPPDALTRVSAVVEGRPDPLRPAHEINPKVLPAVSAVLQQSLAQDRSRRPPTATAMREALRQAAKTPVAAPNTIEPSTKQIVEASTLPLPAVTTRDRSIALVAPPADFLTPTTNARPVQPFAPTPGFQIAPPPAKSRTKIWVAAAGIVFVMAVIAAVTFWPRQIGPTSPVGTSETSATSSEKDGAKTASNGTPLSSREIIARGEQEERNYIFTALPGDLKLTLDVIGEGTTMTVEAFTSDNQPLNFSGNNPTFTRASTGQHEKGVAHLLIDREQAVSLRIKTIYPKSLEAFRLRIEGQAKLPELSGQASNPSSLAALFANRDQPLPLPANVIYSGQSQKKEIYYAFSAGPGEIKFSLNVIAAGAGVDVELFDEQAEPLSFNNNSASFSVSSSELNEQGYARIVLDHQQKLLMRLHTSYPQSLRAFRLKMDGPIQLGAPGNSDAAGAALAPLFAPRDNPEQLKGKELSGRGSGKETYYKLTAGPGTVRFGLEVEGSGPTVTVELFDDEARRLNFDNNSTSLSASSAGPKEKKNAELNLVREEVLLMRLSTTYPESLKEFRLKLEGPVKKP